MTPNDKHTTRLDGLREKLELAQNKVPEQDAVNIINEHEDEVIPWVVELRVIGTPDIIRVPFGETLMLGRADKDLSVSPEIDFTPYRGHALGVSRQHAKMVMRDNRLVIEDLGSANGTYVNGRLIRIGSPMRIRDGDQVRLGNLMLQVHFVLQPHTDEDTMHGLGNDIDVPKIGVGQKILILDDNREVCAVLKMIATRAGFDALATYDTADAIAQWDNGAFDAVIVELMLDNSNGLDLVDYIIRKQGDNHVPIIATNSAVGGYREGQARAKGVNDLITKPLSVDKVMQALDKFKDLPASQ